MLINLSFGLLTMVLCLFLQSLLFVVAFQYYGRHEGQLSTPSFWSSLAVINSVMLLLLVGNLIQIGIWALLFMFLEEFEHFREAFYHSAVNFSTLGYGDIVMSARHKLLGPLEAVNGVLMIGVTSAALIAVLREGIRRTLQARKPQR